MRRATKSLAAIVLMSGTMIPSAFAATTSTGTRFSDVATGSYGAKQIVKLTSEGYLSGGGNGTFHPSAIVTRGQFLTYYMNEVSNLTNVRPNQKAKLYFADVPAGSPAYPYVGAAQQAGWIHTNWMDVQVGKSFHVNSPVSQSDVASVFVSSMSRAGRLKLPNTTSPLGFATNIGIFNGVKLTAKSQLTRASIAIILDNILNWTNGTLLPLGDVPVVTSSSQNVNPNSLVQLSVSIKDKSGHVVDFTNSDGEQTNLPPSAAVSFKLDNTDGALLLPATQSLMISKPGTYKVTVTVDGVPSTPYAITVADEPAAVQLSSADSTLVADGKSTDVITARVVDASGKTMTNFNGSATLMPLLHGSYVDPSTGAAITSVRFTDGVGKLDVRSGTIGGVSDTLSLTNLTSDKQQPIAGNISYGITTINYSWATNEPASVQLTPASSVLSADGQQTDLVKATVVDGFGQPVTSFSGTATVMPLLHGTAMDPTSGAAVNSVTFIHGVAEFAVKAGTTGGVSDTISLTGLTSVTGQVEAYNVNYGSTTISYTWAANQPVGVQLSAVNPTLVADGQQTDNVTATLVDAYGHPVTDFNGTAALTPLSNGTYLNSSTGAATTSVAFTNGIAKFEVKAGTLGGTSDTISLTGLTASSGQLVRSNINYGSTTISYTWPTSSSITLTPAQKVVSNNQATEDPVSATIGDAAGTAIASGTPVSTTFTLAGPASFSKNSSVTTLTEYVIPGVPTVLPVWSIPGQSGTITVTASADDMTTAQITLASGATGAASALLITPSPGTVDALGTAQVPSLPVGTPFTLYTVQLEDANGSPVVPSADDYINVTDNASSLGGTLQYFTVSNGEPSGPALVPSDLHQFISSSTGLAEFAVVNTLAGSSNPNLTISDSLGHTASTQYSFSKGTAAYAVFPLDTPTSLTAASSMMESGQTATYTVQLEDANGNPLRTPGQSINFFFDAKSNTAKATINSSSTWSATAPYTAITNPLGQAAVTVSVPSAAVGGFTMAAQVPGATSSSYETVSVQSPYLYTTQLILSGIPGGSTPLSWPANDMGVGETLQGYLSQANGGIYGLYVVPESNLGANTATGDPLEITTSNPDVLQIASDSQWTAINGSSIMFTGNSHSELPAITAAKPGVATLTITDLANPSAPRITKTITVDSN